MAHIDARDLPLRVMCGACVERTILEKLHSSICCHEASAEVLAWFRPSCFS